ncbi:MAG: hypothetical protein ABI868_26305 [Acidobacteriota bacterium]
MHPVDLDRLIGAELRRLPRPRAPRTLLPRVLAAVQIWTQRPWYERAWFTWPLGLQIGSIAALLLIVAGAAMLLPETLATAGAASSTLAGRVMDDISPATQLAEATGNAVRVIWRVLFEPVAFYAFAIVLLMWVACAAFGTALGRVVFERI